MPIYEYECTACGKHFEHIQKITEQHLSSCPFCSGVVKKLVSNCSFQLKGTGWYVTDYGRKSGDKGKREEGKKEEGKKEEPIKETSADNGKEKSAPKEAVSEKAVNQ